MKRPLWITYAWADNEEGNFDFLVQELSSAGIPATYDRVALVPGRHLWAQIATRIESDTLAGWAYLVSPQSLASRACQEELAFALDRAVSVKGEDFPLIGLLHGVSIRDVPLPLRVRLCVNLKGPDWIEEIRAGLDGIPPRQVQAQQSPWISRVHENYAGQAGRFAIEVRPRFGDVHFWRWAFPSSGPQPTNYGSGTANGGGLSGMLMMTISPMQGTLEGVEVTMIGCANQLSPSMSAYAVFDGDRPKRAYFGVASQPTGIPERMHRLL